MKIFSWILLTGCFLFSMSNAQAGFLDMPEIEEVPEFEQETKLLDMDIPSVRERDPDPESGPRLNVKEFRLQGIVEYPELGITREALIKKVESIRFDMMQEGKELESGYTLKELSEISDLIADIESETKDRHVSTVEVQRLVFLIREQRRSRGVTLGMIENVADVITNFYREKGFILAKAYLPEQKVRDGVVVLTLLLGELGEVDVQNNKRYSDKSIKRYFKRDLGKPVTAERMEEKLYLVNDLPGLNVQGYFEPGSQVGDSKLNVNVVNEDFWSSNIRLDNHGSSKSGEYRAYADVLIHNPTTFQDELHLGVLYSQDPGSATYGSFRYNSHILHPRVRATMAFSKNSYVLGRANTGVSVDIEGESEVAELGASYALRRSRARNHSLSLTAQSIDTVLSLLIGSTGTGVEPPPFNLETAVDNLALGYSFDILNEKSRVLHQGGVTLVYAKLDELGQVSGVDAAEDTYSLNFNYTMLTFLKFPFTQSETRFLFRMVGQYADDPLSSVNQLSLAGANMVRGYTVDKFYADSGVYLGSDWIFSDLFGKKVSEYVQPYLLADYGYGELIPKLVYDTKSKATLSDVGFGFKLKFGRNTRGSLAFIAPMTNKISSIEDEDEEKEDVKVYFDLQSSF
jgi:hemolysin activation/secretion protein